MLVTLFPHLQANELQRSINSSLYEKQRSLDAISKQQRLASRYDAVRTGRRPPQPEENAARVEAQLEEEQRAKAGVEDAVQHLRAEHPHLEDVLDRVARLIDI